MNDKQKIEKLVEALKYSTQVLWEIVHNSNPSDRKLSIGMAIDSAEQALKKGGN